MSVSGRVAPIIELVRTEEQWATLAGEWDALLAASVSPNVFLTWAWLDAWLTEFQPSDLHVVVARDAGDGRLLGAAPFMVEDRRGRVPHRALTFLGSGPAAPDRLDLVVRADAADDVAPALWAAVQRDRSWDLIDLDGLRADSFIAGLTVRRSTDRRHLEERPCPYLSLPATWDAYEASLGKNHRQNLGRYARKMDRELEDVVLRLVATRDEVAATISGLADLHQAVRTARGDRGSFADDSMRRFHTDVALRFHDAGRLRLHRLDVAGRMAAAIYCFRHGDIVSFYSTGYDESLARYGPGRRVMAHAIASAIEEGATGFDFLRGDEPYKSAWGAVDRPDQRLVLPVTARGRIRTLVRTAARMLRRG